MDVFWIDFHFCEGTQYYFHEVRSLNYYLYAIGVSVLALLFVPLGLAEESFCGVSLREKRLYQNDQRPYG